MTNDERARVEAARDAFIKAEEADGSWFDCFKAALQAADALRTKPKVQIRCDYYMKCGDWVETQYYHDQKVEVEDDGSLTVVLQDITLVGPEDALRTKPESDEIERVAAAICLADGWEFSSIKEAYSGRLGRNDYIKFARAAIRSLKHTDAEKGKT